MDTKKIIEQFTDYLLPSLTPYEAVMYIFLLRNAYFLNEGGQIRIGKRTIADRLSNSREKTTAYSHVTELLLGLQGKGCIDIADTTRDGTLYSVFLPENIPIVREKLATPTKVEKEDYFTQSEKREEIFKRDNFICFYCGNKVTPDNATLDHLIPKHAGGQHTKENLKTACLTCNSIKSGKTYDEASPLLLKSIQMRREKRQKSSTNAG